MSSRTEARREVMKDAHEGHEEYHPPARVKRVGPRRWMSGPGGYDYTETMLNWWSHSNLTRNVAIGIIIIILTFIGIMVLAFWIVGNGMG